MTSSVPSKTISLCSAHQQTDPNCPTCNIPLDVRTLDKLVVDGDTLAEIEQGTGDPAGTYMKYRGQIWVNDGWLDDTKACALRDWLTAALSGNSSQVETGVDPTKWPMPPEPKTWMPQWLREFHCKCDDGKCVACQAADLIARSSPETSDSRTFTMEQAFGLPSKAPAKPWTPGGNPVGTSLKGYVHVPYSKIVEVFGEPVYRGDQGDSRVIFDWTITFADGTVATIYDYKQSKLYGDDPDAPTPDEMKALPSFEWHIGGKYQRAVELVHSALNGKGDSNV